MKWLEPTQKVAEVKMISWKEKLLCLGISIVINFAIVLIFVMFVKPQIDQAAKGLAIMWIGR